jgi:predicted ArsR family transcriptional regulator
VPALTAEELPPTRFSGWAGGAGRPFDIFELSKEGKSMNFRPLHDRVLVRRTICVSNRCRLGGDIPLRQVAPN